MRLALAARAHAWMAKQAKAAPDTKVFAMGDFGANSGDRRYGAAGLVRSGDPYPGDTVDRLMAPKADDAKAVGGQAISLTQALFVEGLPPGVYPHSDRIYVWADGTPSFGDATARREQLRFARLSARR